MKQSLLYLSFSVCLYLLSYTNLSAQIYPPGELQIAETTFSFDETEFDFGEIEAGEKVLNVFTFTNTGDEPLVLSNAKGSCGCTVPNWPKEPIAPGESGEIVVVFDSKGKKNKQAKRVTLTANTNPRQTFLTIKANVIPSEDSDEDTAIEPEANEAEVKEKEIEEKSLNSIVLFPNPTINELRINMDAFAGKSATVAIFSTSGKRFKTKVIEKIAGEATSIDVSQLAVGTYLVSIVIDDLERTTKQFSIVR